LKHPTPTPILFKLIISRTNIGAFRSPAWSDNCNWKERWRNCIVELARPPRKPMETGKCELKSLLSFNYDEKLKIKATLKGRVHCFSTQVLKN